MEPFRATLISLTTRIEETVIPYFNVYFAEGALVIRTILLVALTVIATIIGIRAWQNLSPSRRSPLAKSGGSTIIALCGTLAGIALVLSFNTQAVAVILIAVFTVLWGMKVRTRAGIKVFACCEFLCLCLTLVLFGIGWFLFAP
jgi:hypothetical protein